MRYTAVIQIPSIAIKQGIVPEGAQITIAIPTYKRAHLLRETLESCLAQQTNCPFAIMVVDNNPERECETEQLLREYEAIPHLFYYKNTENVGMTGNWNKLFELAQTNFVVMLHDDDLLYDDYIEKIDCILKKYNYDMDALYLDVEIFENDNKETKAREIDKIKVHLLKPFDFQFGNICNLVGAVFNRKTVIDLNGFDNYFYPSFDYELHVRLSFRKKIFKALGYYTLYRISENESINFETILKFADKDKEIMLYIAKNYPKLYKSLLKHYLKAYEGKYIEWNKKIYHSDHKKIDEYLDKKKKEITFFDLMIFKLVNLTRNLLPLFNKNVTLKI